MGRNWLNAETVESCEGVLCRPARSSADVCQRGAVRQHMGGGYTPSEVSPHPQGAHGSPWDWYAKATTSTIQWANLCLETAFPFCWLSWQTKSCSELLKLQVRSTYMRNALTGHSKAKAGSASSEGSACRFTTWSRKGVVGTLGTYQGRGLKTTWEYAGLNTRHSSLTENAWRSPTLLMEVSTVRSIVLADRNFSSTESSGSKGPLWSPARMIERSHEGTRGGLEGFILLAPFRNLTMSSCFPSDLPSTASCPWERRSFLRGMRQGGAVAREMSSGNQVRVGQCGATSRTCSSSSLSLHSVCASRLTGEILA